MKRILRIGTFAVIAFIVGVIPAAAQTAKSDQTALEALLKEVRALRLALEKSALLAPKIQLVLQRVQIQEQKVARISQQLDAVRREIAEEAALPGRVAEEMAAVEAQIAGETDVARRKSLEEQRSALERLGKREVNPELRAREGEIAGSLRAEQAILDELNGKLEALERELEAPPGAKE